KYLESCTETSRCSTSRLSADINIQFSLDYVGIVIERCLQGRYGLWSSPFLGTKNPCGAAGPTQHVVPVACHVDYDPIDSRVSRLSLGTNLNPAAAAISNTAVFGPAAPRNPKCASTS